MVVVEVDSSSSSRSSKAKAKAFAALLLDLDDDDDDDEVDDDKKELSSIQELVDESINKYRHNHNRTLLAPAIAANYQRNSRLSRTCRENGRESHPLRTGHGTVETECALSDQ